MGLFGFLGKKEKAEPVKEKEKKPQPEEWQRRRLVLTEAVMSWPGNAGIACARFIRRLFR